MKRQESAETTALRSLVWLLGEAQLRETFLRETGASAASLAAGADDPVFLGALLDFVLAEDDRVIACARALDCPPAHLAVARSALPGGDVPHWT